MGSRAQQAPRRSKPNSFAVSPLSLHRSTRFANSSRLIRMSNVYIGRAGSVGTGMAERIRRAVGESGVVPCRVQSLRKTERLPGSDFSTILVVECRRRLDKDKIRWSKGDRASAHKFGQIVLERSRGPLIKILLE